ncbi:MAG: sodium/solute symporter [Bacteroidota bacterium]
MLDLLIVIGYFSLVFIVAIRSRTKGDDAEEYFLSSRNLKWPSIAFSTIATNIQGYQFLGMMGSAYLYGLAQANLEINAVQGILLAAFLFVPLYLKEKVSTISQFIEKKLGPTPALIYSLANIFMFSTITIGAALFWGAYAAEIVFEEQLSILHPDRGTRIIILVLILGSLSAIYTFFGGLSAVVKTDIIQFILLLSGGLVILFIAIRELGGWAQLYQKTENLMHLHLPANHEKLPWTHIFGLFLLNINYWCANQSVVQRSLAAKNLKEAQKGLLLGGLMKYLMAVVIVVPGIALVGILGQNALDDPDMAFPYLASTYLVPGIQGIVLCALFASLMSTVDSTFNSISTLWSIDIYKKYLNKKASDRQMIKAGKRAILFAFVTGVTIAIVLLEVKFSDLNQAFTHTLNELRYYINCGIVVMIVAAVILITPKERAIIIGFIAAVLFQMIFKSVFPEMNYFVRAMWVIISAFILLLFFAKSDVKRLPNLFKSADTNVSKFGFGMLASLILLHVLFH